MLTNSNEYLATVEQVKREIKAAQYRAVSCKYGTDYAVPQHWLRDQRA